MSMPTAYDRLFSARHVLLLGAGGGYDVLGAVPLFVELRERGISADVASVSFTSLDVLEGATPDPEHACVVAVSGATAVATHYCPEAWLARWLEEQHGYASPVWCLAKTGIRPLRAALASLVNRLQVDLIVLVDGGVDLVLRGDETSIGTPSEDLATLGAVSRLEPPALAMCIGFGAELREGIRHAQVLERFAELQRGGAFLGAAALEPSSPSGIAYGSAMAFLAAGQADQRGSRIHRVVQSAMRGEFGGDGSSLWVSPLAAIRWFFDAKLVAASHLFIEHLEGTDTMWDVTNAIRSCRKSLPVRAASDIPI